MTEFSVSQIRISKDRAVEMANAKLEWIYKHRDEARKRYITKEMNRRNNSFWRKLTGRFLTYEQVEEEVEEGGIDSPFWWISYRYEDSENLCLAVKTAAQISNYEYITLTLKDAGRLV